MRKIELRLAFMSTEKRDRNSLKQKKTSQIIKLDLTFTVDGRLHEGQWIL